MSNYAKFFLGVFLFLVLASLAPFSLAQAPTGQPTCDACGWCNRNANPSPTPPSGWDACAKCIYMLYPTPEQKDPYKYYTVLGCFSTQPGEFTTQLLRIIFNISGGIAFLAILGGSGMVLTSSGNPERLQAGRDVIVSSIFGLLLIIFSVFLLRVVGLDILKIPGFT